MEFRFPDLGEGIHEGTIVKWHVKVGDSVRVDQVLVEVETDKAIVELPSPGAGTLLKINYAQGQTVKVGEVLLVIGASGESVPASGTPASISAPAGVARPSPIPAATMPPSSHPGHHQAAPATRRLARELNVDIETVIGTGPGGRVTDEDVKAASSKTPQLAAKESSRAPLSAAAPASPARTQAWAPEIASEEGDQRVPLTRLRNTIAERMVYSKTHIPHACGMDYVDVTRLAEIREKEKKNFEPKGVKLTFLPFIVKAVAIALKEYPRFNAHFDEKKGELVIRKMHNIGIAVDTTEGLMVPVVKDVDRKSIVEIAQDIEHLAAAAKERKLRLEDMRGGSFTITNVGSVGGMYSTPIINPPEVAIMGIHRIKELPGMENDKIRARKVMGISMCFDHRVADGAEATVFMNVVMKHLEDPDLMLVDMI
ncbi:2-oxo acid dehydrogenase subunit E2 [Candidatus Micrarchaeota archaeon]|nr:2-oxo acid dehydrogenase subunit E2 [Candidatus Micrarchaeota archaeon]